MMRISGWMRVCIFSNMNRIIIITVEGKVKKMNEVKSANASYDSRK